MQWVSLVAPAFWHSGSRRSPIFRLQKGALFHWKSAIPANSIKRSGYFHYKPSASGNCKRSGMSTARNASPTPGAAFVGCRLGAAALAQPAGPRAEPLLLPPAQKDLGLRLRPADLVAPPQRTGRRKGRVFAGLLKRYMLPFSNMAFPTKI